MAGALGHPGTFRGCQCARTVGAATTGARTLPLERGTVLGGAATLRSVPGYCGSGCEPCEPEPRKAVDGIPDALLTELGALGGVDGMIAVGAGHYSVMFLDPKP